MNENTEQKSVAAEKKSGVFERLKLFLKSNSDMIIKLFVHQFGLTVFGYLLYSAASASENKPLVFGLGIFSAVFYLFLLYILAWDVGSRDKIRIDGGRMKRDVLKGAKVTVVGMLPNLLIATVSLVGFIFKSSAEWAAALYSIAQIIGVFINAMYIGIDEYIGFATNPAYLYLICLPAIIVCGIGYFLGTIEKFGVLTSLPSNGKRR